MRILATLVAVMLLAGCVSSQVRNGATIGAISGAAAGAGVGVLISDKDLLGSEATPQKGNTSLGAGETVAASALIGVVFGAIDGSMIGHVNEPRYGRELNDTVAPLAAPAAVAPETAPDAVEPPAQASSRAATTLRF